MRLSFFVTLVVLLAGCGDASQNELKQWMAEQKRQIKPKVAPVSEPKQFVPDSYDQTNALAPFDIQKLTQALKKDDAVPGASGALIAAELARRKEPLESFPLDAMTLVGHLVKAGQPIALIKIQTLLYQVNTGNYLGQNYGRVMKITETELTLREIVQDPAGEWVERITTLQLQEATK